ncbi:MAG: acetylxylan esterase [Treponema sp.]|jgi:dienelactone hydrolase|nr:acetylxylan esterase [Treponema sp.]
MEYNPLELRRKQFETSPVPLSYRGKDPAAWRQKAGKKIAELLAMPAEKPEDDEFTVEWSREHENCREIRFHFKSEPYVWVPAHLLIPKGRPNPPLVICLQGHGTGMHLSLGRNLEGEEDGSVKNSSHAYALQCVERGMAALAVELRGFGENGGLPEDHKPNCRLLSGSALLLGRTLQGERVWDIMRSIDVICARLEGFDPNRIAIMGVSGGGTTCFYSAIMDTRIAAAMPAACFCSYKDSIGLISHCTCNHVPHTAEYFDMGDLAGLIAPRPLVIVNGNQDQIFPLDGAVKQFARTQEIYRALGAGDNCVHVVADGGHGFYPVPAWDAFMAATGWA